jgi:hypothetical protein
MGLLDDAIREHLELKRRTGADPSAIAREEREVLAPVFPDEDAGPDAGPGGYGSPPAQEASEAAAEIAPVGAVPVRDHVDGGDRPTDLSPAGQETAELDMQAVMEEDPDAADGASPVGPILDGPVQAGDAGETPAEDSLEWEIPSERDRETAPEDVPGQERLSFE